MITNLQEANEYGIIGNLKSSNLNQDVKPVLTDLRQSEKIFQRRIPQNVAIIDNYDVNDR